MTTYRSAIILAALLVLPGYKCGNILSDNGFDLWCGSQLCNWDTEEGSVRRVPTWHARDYGVELVGDRVVISQLSQRTSASLQCLRFELVADVAADVSVAIELDFYDDGTVDHRQAIPTSNWQPLSYLVTMPELYQGVRVRIVKQGSGRAVLADIAAIATEGCVDPPPVLTGHRPEGAWCDEDASCQSGRCASVAGTLSASDRVCSSCASDADCPDGQLCGMGQTSPPHLETYRTCVTPGAAVLGELCTGGDECATGVCCKGVCSTCCNGAGCPAGLACGDRDPSAEIDWIVPPHQCAPGEGREEAGRACLIDDDCASGACTGGGELRVCMWDGRACGEDADCPPDADSFLGGYAVCVPVGSAGGVCQ